MAAPEGITSEQMNRIVRAVQRLAANVRDAPLQVADVLTEELGPQRALSYLDRALAGGLIRRRDFETMRSVVLEQLPREEVPAPTVAKAASELLETQTRMRQEIRRLRQTGSRAFEKPFRDLDADVKRLRRAWGQ